MLAINQSCCCAIDRPLGKVVHSSWRSLSSAGGIGVHAEKLEREA